MQTVSVRIPENDLAWLSSLNAIEGASPSDKIRGLIAEARRRAVGMNDYMACLTLMRDYVQPTQEKVMAFEHSRAMHSEFLALLFLRLPELMAVLVTELPYVKTTEVKSPDGGSAGGRLAGLAEDAAKQAAIDAEGRLAGSTMRLLLSVLRQAVTPKMPAYNPALLDEYLPELSELIDVIMTSRGDREENKGRK